MRLSRTLFLPALLLASGIFAQETAEPTTGTPDVTLPSDGAFVFCSAQDCTGTCEVVNVDTVQKDVGNTADDFLSVYFYNPNSYYYLLYVCIDYYNCATDAQIPDSNTCYNVYDNGTPTAFTEYWYVLDVPA